MRLRSICFRTFLVFILLLIVGCEGAPLKSREAGALGGGALGAGLGAIIGHQTGNAGAGVAIGTAIGALSGALIGNQNDNINADLDNRQKTIDEQDRQLAENRRLIQALRSKGADVRDSDRGVVVNLPDVLFEFDSARLTRSAISTVSEIADVVKGVSDRRILVEGHTDSVGTISYNQRLSENRARSVADELAAGGVPRRRIISRGYGETRPIAPNETDQGRQRNRRVEVIIENR